MNWKTGYFFQLSVVLQVEDTYQQRISKGKTNLKMVSLPNEWGNFNYNSASLYGRLSERIAFIQMLTRTCVHYRCITIFSGFFFFFRFSFTVILWYSSQWISNRGIKEMWIIVLIHLYYFFNNWFNSIRFFLSVL